MDFLYVFHRKKIVITITMTYCNTLEWIKEKIEITNRYVLYGLEH